MLRLTLALVAALLPSLASADCDTCAVELLGDTCTVSGLGSSAIGESTHAIGDYTFATGGHSEAWGRYSFAGGFDSSASGSVAFSFRRRTRLSSHSRESSRSGRCFDFSILKCRTGVV